MALLDVKERNYAKYVLGNIVLPASAIMYFIKWLRPFIEDGGMEVIILAQIGSLVVLYYTFLALRSIYRKLTRTPKNVLSYGKWAVVTGATSGIGESFCYELADRGMNILLISRSEEKLKNVASKVESKYKVQTQYLIRDFADTKDSIIKEFTSSLKSKLEELDNDGGVGMLCNCVGVVNSLPSLLHETDPEEIRQILCVNNDGTVLMSTAVLPFMMKKKSGAIITVSSGSCRHATPLVSLYSATKAFGHQLTRSMHYEYKEYGIDCICVTPYYFISNLYKRKKATYMAPFPETIVNATLPLLGYRAEAFPYWAHWLGCEVATKWTPKDPADRMLVSLKQNRERALAKMKKN